MDPATPVPPVIPSPLSPDSRSIRDREHLNLLAVFHFLCAGLAMLGIGFLGLHFLLFAAVFTHGNFDSGFPWHGHFPVGLLAIFYVFFALWLIAALVLNLLSGCFLLKRRHRLFSIVVAALNCAHIPFGTILGVFTLVVLSRESVRREYPSGI